MTSYAESPFTLLTTGSGGSILTELIERNSEDRYTISALIRKPYQASILKDAGVNALIFKDLDDYEAIRDTANDHDSVFSCSHFI